MSTLFDQAYERAEHNNLPLEYREKLTDEKMQAAVLLLRETVLGLLNNPNVTSVEDFGNISIPEISAVERGGVSKGIFNRLAIQAVLHKQQLSRNGELVTMQKVRRGRYAEGSDTFVETSRKLSTEEIEAITASIAESAKQAKLP